jgi:FADH2-dependent halogenase
MAMFLAREGIKPVILEQEEFPRFHIGESMTGEAAQVVRRLGLEEEMTKSEHPVKHGVKVFGTSGENSWFVPVSSRDKDWNLTYSTTWQVRRSNFDTMMLKKPKRGATVMRGTAIKPLLAEDGAARGVKVRWPDGKSEVIETQVVLDCSGQATFLANQRATGPKYLGNYDKQVAFFSQVTGTVRGSGPSGEEFKDNTLIFYAKKFHWSWFIPLDDDVVSVGMVTPNADFLAKKQTPEEFFRNELYDINPELRNRIPEMNLVEKVHVIPNYSYQVRGFCGKGFICIGDAHRFIDPIFSFGLTVTMREAEFAAPIVREYWRVRGEMGKTFGDHQVFCEQAIDNLEDMIDVFWEQPFAFATFVYHRHPDQMTDAFAGRIYPTERQPSQSVAAFRKMLKRTRDYGNGDDYSMPIGSRFHPERAAIWEPNSPVETTEQWMGAR